MHFAICDYVLDIVHNSIEAGAMSTDVLYAETGETIAVRVADDGHGMDRHELERAMDPFGTNEGKHPGRSVGLGIPFVQQAAEQTGGQFQISSRKGEGTTVSFTFRKSHVDMPPVGDLVGLFAQVLSFDGAYEMVIGRLLHGAGSYELRRSELVGALGALTDVVSQRLLREYIGSQEESLAEC